MFHVLYQIVLPSVLFYFLKFIFKLCLKSTVVSVNCIVVFHFVLRFVFVCVQLGDERNWQIWFCYLRSAVIGWYGKQIPFTGLRMPSLDGFLLVNDKMCVFLFLWKPHLNIFWQDANELIDYKIILRPNFFFNLFHLPCTYHHALSC